MALEENGNSGIPATMLVGPTGNNGMGFGDGNGWWILLLFFLLAGGNGWGNGWGGNGGGFVNADIQRGFDQSALTTGINNLQTAMCNGFAGVNQGVANGFAQAEIAANARQMADMNQNFALQTAFQNCCCENRLATAGLNTTIAQESAATRSNCDANNQKILDKLCQLELDGVRQNYEGQLRAMQYQLNQANAENQTLRFLSSQGAQTAQIVANNEAQTAALEQYLAPTPRPAYVVQNPNCCGNQYGYGCGCGA